MNISTTNKSELEIELEEQGRIKNLRLVGDCSLLSKWEKEAQAAEEGEPVIIALDWSKVKYTNEAAGEE